MLSTLAEHPMSKHKRNDVAVKVDAEVIRTARIVAAYRGLDLNEYLSEVLGPIVRAHHAQHAREVAASEGAAPKSKGKPPPSS